MNGEDRRLLSSWANQLSPTLNENYKLVEALERVPICVACPMAQWYKLEAAPSKPSVTDATEAQQNPPTLECFCTVFRGVMYDGRRVVTACDAFQDALDEQNGPDNPSG